MNRIFGHLTYANVVATLALVIAVGSGTAYAANTVFSRDIVNGEVRTADIGTNEVRGVDVRNDTLTGGGLTGVDIVESTLQNVNAGTVGGLQIRRINFQVPPGTGPTTVLNLAGLQITAECQPFGDQLDVKAFTSKNDAAIDFFGAYAGGIPTLEAFRTTGIRPGNFDVGQVLNIDSPPYNGTNNLVTLNYSAPDGSVVVVDLAQDELGEDFFEGCALTGIAIGG